MSRSERFDEQLALQRKWTFRAHGQSLVSFKKSGEKSSHVYLKAFLWGIYLPSFPDITVEVSVGLRYKPDLVSWDEMRQRPRFWGECGQVTLDKLGNLFRRFPETHFAVAKWEQAPFWVDHLAEILKPLKRKAPVDLLIFKEPSQRLSDWLNERGEIQVRREDVLQASWG